MYSSIGLNSTIKNSSAELISVYYEMFFIIQFWPLMSSDVARISNQGGQKISFPRV